MAGAIYDEKAIISTYLQIGNAQGTDDLGTNGSAVIGPWRADLLVASNDDTIDHVLFVGAFDSYQQDFYKFWWSVTVPAGAGYGTTPVFDVLEALGTVMQGGLIFYANRGLAVKVAVAVTAGKTLTLILQGGEL